MSISIYSWNIPDDWKRGLNSKTTMSAKAKLTELEQLVKCTLRANPGQGVTIDQALQSRQLQKRQMLELTELLAKSVNENTVVNNQIEPFFEDKVRHNTSRIRQLYLKIVELSTKKEPYQKIQIVKLLKAYENFVAKPKSNVAEQQYNVQRETEFFERLLTVVLHTSRFDLEFNWIKEALSAGEKGCYNITASKIITKVNIGIEGRAIDTCLKRAYSEEDLTEITTVKYFDLLSRF